MNPSNPAHEVVPPRPPGAVGLIETDRFCLACGYNLRLQPVTRDERLGLLVCRCPECGVWDSAREATSPWRAWGGRLAMLGGIVWVLLALAVVGWTFAGLVATQVAAAEELATWHYETSDGVTVSEEQIEKYSEDYLRWLRSLEFAGRPRPAAPTTPTITARPTLVDWIGGEPATPVVGPLDRLSVRAAEGWSAVFSCAIGTVLVGAIFSASSWWWPGRRRFWWLLLPTLAACLSGAILYSMDDVRLYADDAVLWHYLPNLKLRVSIVLATSALQCGCFAAGLLWGRPVLRGMLRAFCPPGIRQHFAFLWQCDGIAMKRGSFVPQT